MLSVVWNKQMEKKALLIWAGIFVFVFGLYSFFDVLAHGTLSAMMASLGLALFALHIVLNAVMALMTSAMLSLTQIKLRLTKTEPKGSTSIPAFSFVFAVFTFGCTPCVVAFMAAVGIAFTPLVFPHGNLLWKIMLLLLIAVGFVYILFSIQKGNCKVKLDESQV